MRRKLLNWMMALSAGLFVVPLSTCATSAVNGVIQTIRPCDFLNCEDPQYIDPCMFLQCERTTRTTQPIDTTTTDTNTGGNNPLAGLPF